MTDQCAVVIGVGAREGIGAAVAIKAAQEGLHVFIAGRTLEKLQVIVDLIQQQGGHATAVVADSTKADDIAALFKTVAKSGMPVQLVVYNTGRNIPSPFLESNERLFQGHWRRCVLGPTLVAQAALPLMLKQEGIHKGSLLFTGASASMRGKPLFAGFASAKAGQRALAQSLAREFSPQGIHVAHIVIDGVVEGEIVRSFGGGLGKLLLRNKGKDGALLPDEVAKNFWMVHQQAPSTWTQELDLRPYKESF
ncbi:MAG: SDR family NAD(P)-dependent oxidoreductase [Salinisphaeraceae bacterium]|nr:SDR family NAD(P)-dependent oxidoreductase [Salinisphaeraceae bacterium]